MKVKPLKLMLGHALSRLVPQVFLPSELRTEDVCRDPDIRSQADDDPLNHRVANARWFTEALAATALIQSRAPDLNFPILPMYAENDRIVDAAETRRLLDNVPECSWQAVSFAEAAHELFNEPPAERG